MDRPAPMITLPADWFTYRVADDARVNEPGIYQWDIEGAGIYVGKYKKIRRPTKEYGRNVTRQLNAMPYRLGNPNGFRRVHRELVKAHLEGRKITLTILENVASPLQQNKREKELIRERGSLNMPAFDGFSAPQKALVSTSLSSGPGSIGLEKDPCE